MTNLQSIIEEEKARFKKENPSLSWNVNNHFLKFLEEAMFKASLDTLDVVTGGVNHLGTFDIGEFGKGYTECRSNVLEMVVGEIRSQIEETNKTKETCSGDHATPHELNMCDDCAKIK
jgi:hypothetical protein